VINEVPYVGHRVIFSQIPYLESVFQNNKPEIFHNKNIIIPKYTLTLPFDNITYIMDCLYNKNPKFTITSDEEYKNNIIIFDYLLMYGHIHIIFRELLQMNKKKHVSLEYVRLFLNSTADSKKKGLVQEFTPRYHFLNINFINHKM